MRSRLHLYLITDAFICLLIHPISIHAKLHFANIDNTIRTSAYLLMTYSIT